MATLSIREIDKDRVTIEGAIFPRPQAVCRTRWLEFWEDVLRGDFDSGWEHGHQVGYAKGWRDKEANDEYDERPE
jgi:hypothetical protein